MEDNLTISKTKKTGSSGLLSAITQMVILICLLVSAGVFFMNYQLQQKIITTRQNIQEFPLQPNQLFLDDVKNLNRHIAAGERIFKNHLKLSTAFSVLEKDTIKTIRFDQFEYKYEGQKNSQIKIYLIGEAESYNDIANQSDIFSENPLIGSHIFSDFIQRDNGNIGFKLNIFFKPEAIFYQQNLMTS